ncbi:MAG: Type I Iterative PKS [Bathelium mastoideum]|nr:MAG: Type I Iterative PKS [Bathelium mastoideum]
MATVTRSETEGDLSQDVSPNAIAVVGMGCKFPGADSVEEYWRLLDAGRSMLSEPPSKRFPTHEHPRNTEKTVYFGNYLDDLDSFDNRFFKKSGREAASMDPQQRLLLEVSYQALESAGFFGPREPDLDVGCFLGVCASDYNDNVASHPPNAFSALGTLRAFVPGRVSHFFGLSGPSVAIDTACSSSAVAIDAACKAILCGDCKSALAGGVSVLSSPFFYQNLAAASFLSPTGASKSFDAGADGYCRGEGVGLVVLKRFSQAVADGDNVLGTILATSVRQSSNKVPITVPYSASQTALYRKLLNTAGIAAEDVTFVEAHGTGTPVGDPLEYEAIKEVFCGRPRQSTLHLASVKGNIGHQEGASGVAGLIKTILMMQNRTIPRQANYLSPHPKITLIPGQISIPTENLPWNAKSLVACVNNYGAAGSIAAMIVKEPPSNKGRGRSLQTIQVRALSKYPLIITANSAKSLGQYCTKLRDYVSSFPHGSAARASLLADLTFNLSDKQNRSLPNIFATTVSSLSELNAQLNIITSNSDSSMCQTSPKPNPIVLVFGGQTTRSVGLNKEVYETSALLRKYLDECDLVLKGFGYRGIYPQIFETKPTDDVVSNQTMQFALQYACAQSWIACGMNVDAVLGHSFGQLVALAVAGVLSLVDGLRLVYGRAVLMRDRWGLERGSMIALEASCEEIMSLVTSIRNVNGSSNEPEVACYNGPKSHVVVGSAAEIAEIARKTTTAKAKVLDVTHGFHSRFCDPILPDLQKLAQSLTFNEPKIWVETCSEGRTWPAVTAKLVTDHTRAPVYFGDAVKRIATRYGACTWLEAGSNSSVTSIARRALSDQDGQNSDNLFCPIDLTRDDALGALADTTARLWKHGHHVQFWPFHHIHKQDYLSLNLPPYQFERSRHWLDFDLGTEKASKPTTALSEQSKQSKIEPEPEPVLITFSHFQDTGNVDQSEAVFTIDPRSEEWRALVAGHSVLRESLCPAPLYIELVMQAANQLASLKSIPCAPFARVDDLEMPSPLGMSQDKIIQLVLCPCDLIGLKFNFTFLAQGRQSSPGRRTAFQSSESTTTHATGRVEIISAHDNAIVSELERTRKLLHHMRQGQSQDQRQKPAGLAAEPDGEAMQGSLVYKVFSRVVQYYDFYKGVRRVSSMSDGAVSAEVSVPEQQPNCTQGLLSTPVAIDNFFQVPGIFANSLAPCPSDEVFVSTHVDRIQLSPEFGKLQAESGRRSWDVFAMSTALGDKESSNDIFVTDQTTGQLVFVAFGCKFSRVRTATLAKILSRANPGQASVATSTTFAQRDHIDNAPVPSAKPLVMVSAPLQHHHQFEQQQPLQQPPSSSIATIVDKTLAPSPSVTATASLIASVEIELREMLSELTEVPADLFKSDVSLEDLGIDSLMTTEIVSKVQDVFSVSISQDRIQALQTFGSLCKYLDAHGSRRSPSKPLEVPEPQPTPVTVPLPQTLPGHEIANQSGILGLEIKQTTPLVLVPTSQENEQHQDAVSRLAELLSSHLECPASIFERSTNLADCGLDSLLCMELMSDIKTVFGVSIDLSVLISGSTFGDLSDLLVNAIAPLEHAAATDSSSSTSTETRSPDITTPLTIPTTGINTPHISTVTTKMLSSSSDALASAPQAFEGIKADFDKFAKEYAFSDFYSRVADKQGNLVLAYTIEAFSDLGIDLRSLNCGDQIPRLNVIPKHDRLLNVLYEILRHGKLADYDGRAYVRSDVPVDQTHSSILHKEIVTKFPQHAKEHELLGLCGPEMSNFLSGKTDPLQVLFGTKTNRSILEDVYSTAPMFVIESQLLTNFIEKSLSTSVPGPDGKFHIVELGAGTGATTRWVVDRLVQRGIPIEYTFTDISSSLLINGKRKFSKFDCMKYAVIDIEKEPEVQYQGQFDIVLATNCIHATSNLQNSLTNINKLLKPHGIVSLVELTTRNYWLDLVFGLLDGWWLYDDGRPYVLATPEFWDKSMRQTGFQHVAWTGGHTRESEVCRVIAGFKRPVEDPSQYRSVPQEKAGGVETVVFAHTDKRLPLRADIFYPSSSQASAHGTWVAGLLVHGGGHVMLSRKDLRPRQIQLLLDNGVLPVAVDYRLCPETTILEGPLVDISNAYAWLRNEFPSLHLTRTATNKLLDPVRAVAIGWSTGGTLAMSLSWTSPARGLSAPTAILGFYCPTDYEDPFWTRPNIPEHSSTFPNETYNVIDGVYSSPITSYNVPSKQMVAAGWIAPSDKRSRVALHMNWRGQTLPVLFRGLPSASTVSAEDAAAFNDLEQPPREDVIKASPYAQIVRGNYKTPTHIVFGTKDDLIPWLQAQRTVEAMREKGIQCGFTLAEGEIHLFDLYRDPDGKRWQYVLEGYKFLLERIGREFV